MSLEKWDLIYTALEDSFSEEIFDFLLKNAVPRILNRTQCVIEVDAVAKSFLIRKDTENYKKVYAVISHYLGNELDLMFVEKEELLDQSESVDIPVIKQMDYESTNLNSSCTFENYFYTEDNASVIQSCNKTLKYVNTENAFTPLLIHGVSGIGKSHLLFAMGNELYKKNPELKIVYVTAGSFREEFTNSFKGGIDNNALSEFNNKYNNLDVLMFDDIQELEGNEKTEDAFYAFFDKLYLNKKLVIVSCDKKPTELKFAPRLLSRFESGINLRIENPNSGTKTQIFKSDFENIKKIDGMFFDIDITEEAIDVYVENSQNVRALKGYIEGIRLKFINEFKDDGSTYTITKDDAIKYINENSSVVFSFTADDIIKIGTRIFNLSKEELLSGSKSSNITNAKSIIAFYLKKTINLNNKEIANRLGYSDHTGVIKAIGQERLTKAKSSFPIEYEQITSEIYKQKN
ncbi:MAG: DnaA ATPase domain-containing protein [Mycoplasmatales bacterium]